MVLSEPEGLLRIAMVDLETAEASTDPAVFREGAWGFWLVLLLGAEGVNTDDLQQLAQLTIYAVQFRYDADAAPMGLNRAAHGSADNLQLLPHYQQPCENGKLGSATCRADEHQQAKELKG